MPFWWCSLLMNVRENALTLKVMFCDYASFGYEGEQQKKWWILRYGQ